MASAVRPICATGCGGHPHSHESETDSGSTFHKPKKKLAIASATRDGIRDRATGWVICGGLSVARHPRGDLDGGWCQQTPKRACFSIHEQQRATRLNKHTTLASLNASRLRRARHVCRHRGSTEMEATTTVAVGDGRQWWRRRRRRARGCHT